MSIWIKYEKISETDGIVIEQNFVPSDPINGVSEERSSQGMYIDSIPVEPPINIGQENILHINPTTLELFWVTVDVPKTAEQIAQEKIKSLETQLEVTNQAIAEITMMITPSE